MKKHTLPTLDLHGYKHVDVQNEVVRFLEDNLNSGLFVDIITGQSSAMSQKVIEVLKQYDLEYVTGLPHFGGRIRVVMYDYENDWGNK